MAAVKRRKYTMSRTQKKALIVGFFFILLPVLLVVDHRFGGGLRQRIERATYATADFQKYHERAFTVLAVVDGDTIDLDIPDGQRLITRIRLIGVDTPETKHPKTGLMYYGPEATDFTKKMVLGNQVTVLLDTVADQRDRYGRLLAYIVLPNGKVLNAELIRQGYGYAYLSFPHSEFTTYQSLMDQAIAEKRGLWQNVTRQKLPQWLRSKRPELLRYTQDQR
jgi:micrococcal nuclease